MRVHPSEVGPFLTGKPWTEESNRQNPDWPAGIAALERLFDRALAWGVPELALEAARIVTIIHDETIHDHAEALAALDRFESRLEKPCPAFGDARAGVLFNHEEYAASLAIWERIFPVWSNETGNKETRLMLAYRNAGMAAGRLNEWRKAAGFFTEGRRLAQVNKEPAIATGLLADAAFAFLRQGDHPRFLKDFETVLSEIERLPDMRVDLRTLHVHRAVGQILLWLHSQHTPAPNVAVVEPAPGMCSNPEPDPKLRDLVETFPDGSWLHLVLMEFYLAQGRSLYLRWRNRLRSSALPWVSFQFSSLELSYAFRDQDFGGVAKLCRARPHDTPENYRTLGQRPEDMGSADGAGCGERAGTGRGLRAGNPPYRDGRACSHDRCARCVAPRKMESRHPWPAL